MFGKLTLTMCLALMLSACGAHHIELGKVEHGGDFSPVLTAQHVKEGKLENLGFGEAVVVALGNTEMVASSETAKLSFIEDLSNDQIQKALETKTKNKPYIKMISGFEGKDANQKDRYFSSVPYFVHEVQTGKVPTKFSIMALNIGEAEFAGDLIIHNKFAPDIKFIGISKKRKIVDQRALKAGLRGIPFVELVTLAMDDFSTVDADPHFRLLKENNVLSFEFGSTNLKSGEGMHVVLDVEATMPELDEMRRNAKPTK
ncbi:MAG: hypothetical protein HQM03_01535 [Magnetococcales bacterium]|nr:hypothetical protein [Magnetococcales bacterium]